jgi:hypothetical protein
MKLMNKGKRYAIWFEVQDEDLAEAFIRSCFKPVAGEYTEFEKANGIHVSEISWKDWKEELQKLANVFREMQANGELP